MKPDIFKPLLKKKIPLLQLLKQLEENFIGQKQKKYSCSLLNRYFLQSLEADFTVYTKKEALELRQHVLPSA